jgi:hypothetical protein
MKKPDSVDNGMQQGKPKRLTRFFVLAAVVLPVGVSVLNSPSNAKSAVPVVKHSAAKASGKDSKAQRTIKPRFVTTFPTATPSPVCTPY